MVKTSAKVKPGDTLVVEAWAPWLYFVVGRNFTGYISWKALSGGELDSIAAVIGKQSQAEEDQMGFQRPSLPQPNAYLSMKAVKSTLLPGECTPVTLAFHVSDSNRARIQFFDLQSQLSQGLHRQLDELSNAWVVRSHIKDIVANESLLKGFTTYKIDESALCPTSDATAIQIQPVRLGFLQYRGKGQEPEDTVYFFSKPMSIKVANKPAPNVTDTSNFYVRIGQFEMTDEFPNRSPRAKQAIEYKVILHGKGLLAPFQPPDIKVPGVVVHDILTEDSDTLVRNVLESKKVFKYMISFSQEGTFAFKDLVKFTYFDTVLKTEVSLRSKASVIVKGIGFDQLPQVAKSIENNIALDVSQSMLIEDCDPNRLEMVKKGLDIFLSKRNLCDFGIILFAGASWKYSAMAAGKCYSAEEILPWEDDHKGTAIGDAVLLAANEPRSPARKRKLLLISDGDNTTGYVPVGLAARIARKNQLTVSCIGVGQYGPVKYGKDFNGKPIFVTDTFRERSLKFLASKTNGKYYRANKPEEVARILHEFLR